MAERIDIDLLRPTASFPSEDETITAKGLAAIFAALDKARAENTMLHQSLAAEGDIHMRLREECERLRKGLEFYALGTGYERERGIVAREALAATGDKGGDALSPTEDSFWVVRGAYKFARRVKGEPHEFIGDHAGHSDQLMCKVCRQPVSAHVLAESEKRK
jgi:hypothetical protein